VARAGPALAWPTCVTAAATAETDRRDGLPRRAHDRPAGGRDRDRHRPRGRFDGRRRGRHPRRSRGGGTLSSVVDVESARLGDAHESAAAIERRDDVAYATPVLTEAVRIRTAGSDEPETVLAMGVVPPDEPTEIEGVSTASLEPGTPLRERELRRAADGRNRADGRRGGRIDAAAGDDLEVRGRCSKRRTGPSRTIGLRRTP